MPSGSSAKLQQTVRNNRKSGAGGVYSVCSAHPWVIEAALDGVVSENSIVLVESTSSQVNQEGGYTGQTPAAFARNIHAAAERAGLSTDRMVLGGDHLGPFPWRNQKAAIALEKAGELVRACVLAGYQKIHLDASMACADDAQNPPADAVVAQRAAVLAESAEKAFAELPGSPEAPVYVIGTEVPAPGGETVSGAPPSVTTTDHAGHTLQTFQAAFEDRKLFSAWGRVIALVVQPGVEFGDDVVFTYDREKAQALSSALPRDMPIVYEAHSTDYQPARALREMVEDHFAILKVGPWLTFAFREAVFALSAIEEELLSGRKGTGPSEVRRALEDAMLRNPVYWKSYYHGDESQQRLARAYSYSDRCRYYWPEANVQQEVDRLFKNLEGDKIPPTLVSQYLPMEYEAYRAGEISIRPQGLVRNHIRAVLRQYQTACGPQDASIPDAH